MSEAWVRAADELAESWVARGDLDRAIGIRRAALDRLPAGVPDWMRLDLTTNLGIDVMERYRRGGDVADLVEARAIAERVWAASPVDRRVAAAAYLAGRIDDPERGARILEEALDAAADDDPERPVGISAFAGVHVQLWQRDQDRERLDAALRRVSGSLDPAAAGPEVINVAGLIADAARESSDPELLAEAESLVRAALAAGRPMTAGVRVALCRLLAAVLLERYEWTGDRDALARARSAAEDAVEAAGTGLDRARALSIRSMVRFVAASLTGDRPGSAAAVDDARAALALDDDVENATNLAGLLAQRYDLFGDGTDLDDAIRLLDRVLAGGPPADMAAAVANNQANNLLARFERDAVPADAVPADAVPADAASADLDEAIRLAEAAVAATAPDSADLAARHDTAGRLYAGRAHHLGHRDDLDTAERHAERAVAATAASSPDRAHYLNNRAMWLTDRWENDADERALNRAIEVLEEALGPDQDIEGQLAATIAFNLGARLNDRFDLDLGRGRTDMATLQRAADLFDEVLGAGYPHLALVAGKRFGDIAWRAGMWPEAQEAFGEALSAAGELTGMRPRHPDKERARSGVQGLGALAALAAVRTGDVRGAAVHLEQASATLIAEAIGVRAETVSFAGIAAAAERMDRHVLLLGCTRAGGIAVLVAPDGAVGHAELPLAVEPEVDELAATFRQALRDAEESPDAAGARVEAVDRLAAWTHEALVAPLLPLVAGVHRLAVLPLGRLAWLPITSCGAPGGEPALGRHEPVLLIRADTTGRPQPAAVAGPSPTASAARPSPARVVVWADTGPAERPIPAVAREARRVARQHPGVEPRIDYADRPRSGVPADDALTSEVFADDALLDGLLDADLVHLACHCDVDVDHPQDTVLRVRPPIRVGLRAGPVRRRCHVVLSACDAALTGAALPDEALSAATAFLLAGAGTVTAPLWPANDATAPRLMGDYHARLAAGADPASALAAVQREWSRHSPAYVHGPWVVTAWPDTASSS
jgi:tetratricopeptide (TPR) repeat protein